MSKIPTAETVLEYLIPDCKTAMTAKQYKNALTAIKMHSQYYVKAALEAAANNISTTCLADRFLDTYDSSKDAEGNIFVKDSILKAYPENLIV